MKRVIVILLISIVFISFETYSETVKVGGYVFPPFVEQNGSDFHGITIDLIDEMNNFQNKYVFEFFETTAKRRYNHFDNGNFDIIIFEDTNWGWQEKNIQISEVINFGGEHYIAKAEPMRNQNYFDDLSDKSISVILGYHYGFARFNSDEQFLVNNFNIQFSRNHENNIIKVIEGRTDIALVTKSYLSLYLSKNPHLKQELIVSDKLDQIYKQRILLRAESPITKDEINNLLFEMGEAGILTLIWKKYGMD